MNVQLFAVRAALHGWEWGRQGDSQYVSRTIRGWKRVTIWLDPVYGPRVMFTVCMSETAELH